MSSTKTFFEEVGPTKLPSGRWRYLRAITICLGLLAVFPVTCCIVTAKRQAEFDQFRQEALRLGGDAHVPPGDAGWDGLGITTYIALSLGPQADDADLERLSRLPAFTRLNGLSLRGTRATAESLGLLTREFNRKVPPGGIGLSRADLTDTAITEAEVRSLLEKIPNWKSVLYGSSKLPVDARGEAKP
jgi:hypothetical protein